MLSVDDDSHQVLFWGRGHIGFGVLQMDGEGKQAEKVYY